MAIDFDKQNDRVIEWMRRTEAGLKGNSSALGIKHRANSPSPGPSVQKIKAKERMKSGIVEAVRFSFPRSLVWPHKGAGKGMGGLLGSTWTNALGIKKTTNPESLGKMGTGSRKEKQWFNKTMEAETGVDELATIVAEESGDAVVNNLLIK